MPPRAALQNADQIIVRHRRVPHLIIAQVRFESCSVGGHGLVIVDCPNPWPAARPAADLSKRFAGKRIMRQHRRQALWRGDARYRDRIAFGTHCDEWVTPSSP